MAGDRPDVRATRSEGFVELVNESHEPIGGRQPCEFEWEINPGSATVQLLTDHDFVFAAAEGAVSYIAIRNGDGALMFMLRIPDRVVGTGIFGIGPHRSGLVQYRRNLP